MKTKTKTDESENSNHKKKLLLALFSSALILVSVLIGTYFLLHSVSSVPPRAAIIDQVSSSQLSESSRHVNQTFIQVMKTLLHKRFSEVDYYSNNATVDQYQLLPSRGYKLIIWRAHSALNNQSKFVAICSSEKYDSKKYDQYTSEQLTLCNITYDPQLYFAITPTFVKECMNGRFEDTVIVLMSCNGLKEGYYSTAEAFLEKGVKAFMSWDGWITFQDNDDAMPNLLRYLIDENNTIREAVNKIPTYTSEFGSSTLNSYPYDADDYRIPDYRQIKTAIIPTSMVITARRKTGTR